jgi:hypothetical protein
MAVKTTHIPIAMLLRKFYCHRCGSQLTRHPNTNTYHPSDPGYWRHNRIGRTHFLGPVEVTEYDFRCPQCNTICSLSEQQVTERIQKTVGRHILSAGDVQEYRLAAAAAQARKKRITSIIFTTIWIIFLAFFLYMLITNGSSIELFL